MYTFDNLCGFFLAVFASTKKKKRSTLSLMDVFTKDKRREGMIF